MEGTASGAYKEARGWERDLLSGGIIREEIIGLIKVEEGVTVQGYCEFLDYALVQKSEF